MNTKEDNILEEIRNLSVSKRRKLSYEELKEMLPKLSCDEIIEMSRLIGYPVFTRLCMREIGHQFFTTGWGICDYCEWKGTNFTTKTTG